jgi:polysaccharide deacetylase 2 family uncharacterized protein YibQ
VRLRIAGAVRTVRLDARLGGWRGLGLFWAGILLCLGGLAATLQLLGPAADPPAPRPVAVAAKPSRAVAASTDPPRPGRAGTGPVAAPDAALLERVAGDPPRFLPRIASDGRAPMAVYAAGFPPGTQGPRVGLILAGFGLDHPGSEAAAKALPGGVTLAVSPYARDLDPLLASVRASGHEYLLSVPMEPRGFGLNDPGDQALMTALPPEENARRLDRVLSRVAGYVGVTGALGRLRGERFAAEAVLIDPVLRAVAGRGLLYVDPRPDAPPLPAVWSRHVDVLVDDTGTDSEIDAQLAELSRIARERGSALGLAGAVRPVTVERIAAWTRQLAAQGIELAPVSALVEALGKSEQPR